MGAELLLVGDDIVVVGSAIVVGDVVVAVLVVTVVVEVEPILFMPTTVNKSDLHILANCNIFAELSLCCVCVRPSAGIGAYLYENAWPYSTAIWASTYVS